VPEGGSEWQWPQIQKPYRIPFWWRISDYPCQIHLVVCDDIWELDLLTLITAPLMGTATGPPCSCLSAVRRTKFFPRFGRTRTGRVCALFFRHGLTPSSVEGYESAGVGQALPIATQRSIVWNLFGRHLCLFASGFRKSDGNGLLSAFDSSAALPAF